MDWQEARFRKDIQTDPTKNWGKDGLLGTIHVAQIGSAIGQNSDA